MFKRKPYTRFNLSESKSDINVFVDEYRSRIYKQYEAEESNAKTGFFSFAERKMSFTDLAWLNENDQRFFYQTPNEQLAYVDYLSETGFIFCMEYSPDGEYIVCGHSTGLIQMDATESLMMGKKYLTDEEIAILKSYSRSITGYYEDIHPNIWYPMFSKLPHAIADEEWVSKNEEQFFKGTRNEVLYNRWYFPELGAVMAMEYSPNGAYIVVGHASGAIQMRHGKTGVVMSTLRNMQFPPKPVYAIQFSPTEDRICYAACGDGCLYRIEIPNAIQTYKVHKLRLAFIPKKLQRMHSGQVCSVRCHAQKENLFASAGWDNTLRVWDLRCQIGCVMTFEGVNVCHDSIDLNRDHLISGSWQPTDALVVWDLVARKKQNVIRVQNRRPNVDGEYIYACRFWKSTDYNRKGKYAIIGGSGTNCLEVINLHNRYIACSYPHIGSVLAVTSFQERIAFAGTAPVFNIVTFHDPKHETYADEVEPYEYSKPPEGMPVSAYEGESSNASYVGGG